MTNYARWQSTITDDEGNVQPGASVEVRSEAIGAPLATLYADRTGLTLLGNPVVADADGFVYFHVAGGAYKITASFDGDTRIWRYVGIGTGQEADFSVLGTAGRLARYTGTALGETTGLYEDGSGNVGVNTTSADARFSVNGVASFGDGAVGAPSLAHFGDLDTGWWFPAANTAALSAGGIEALRVNISGATARLGLGCTPANAKFEIAGTGTGVNAAKIGIGETSVRLWYLTSGGVASGKFSIVNGSGGTDPVTIDSSNNVGIQTGVPDAKLSVNGALSVGGGSVSAPGLATFGNLDTGVWLASHLVGLAVEGVAGLQVADTSSITVPTSRLGTTATHVAKTGSGVLQHLSLVGVGAAGAYMSFFPFGGGTNVAAFFAQFARGTSASPTAAQSGDNLLSLAANGYDSSGNYGGSANIIDADLSIVAVSNFTSTDHGTQLRLRLTPVGAASPVEVWRTDGLANFMIGGTAMGSSAAKCLGLFNGTAPGSNISGVQAYALSGVAKIRDSSGNIISLDTLLLRSDTAATLTKGFYDTPYSNGTVSSGTLTPDAANGNLQYVTNGGAHTLAPMASASTVILEITNNGSAGAITTSGFTKVVGDAFTTTNGHKFLCTLVKSQTYSLLNVIALQ